ncbi:hypothetical protein FGO68_gene17216 [Halteria grandinella]|uniref:Uncharacterized protein n=1 Tax=Halteria grandinella TaxID=5974 RepID=A0A8J8TA93_HALGN|nr:hypothetical protein FGO68_gene17216 [Halteria grandinella]
MTNRSQMWIFLIKLASGQQMRSLITRNFHSDEMFLNRLKMKRPSEIKSMMRVHTLDSGFGETWRDQILDDVEQHVWKRQMRPKR